MATPNIPFHAIDLDAADWQVPDGYPDTITQVVLVDTLDEVARSGMRVLLMRFAPGAQTTSALTHSESEDVFVFEGDLIVGGGVHGADATFEAPAFACRPGGVLHGPFSSRRGCLMYVRFSYDD